MDASSPTFGLCMIVKNGAHMLWRILDKVQPPTPLNASTNPSFDQVVILDTGSTDGTVEMLKERYPWVEVHETTWQFDFSKARNEALSHMKTDVWMWLDADDTFTDSTLVRWFEIAKELWDRRHEPKHAVYALIPYIYKVDKNDLPVVVHFRERILLGHDWEWKEPLHEVCHYLKPDGLYEAYNDCPVVHKPLEEEESEKGAHYRNWKIMMRHYLNGDRSDRTLYYLGRMAVVEKQYEFAIQVASELAERNAGGYYEYESMVAAGDAYAELYKRDDVPEYRERAIEYLTRAKRFEPARNEARVKLCDLYIHDKDAENALKEANALNEAMPATVATTLPDQYGRYKYAVLTMIYFRMVGNLWNALNCHFKAIDCPRPNPIAIQMDDTIRQYIRDQNIAIMYCDEKYNGVAMQIRDWLRTRKGVGEALIFNDPHCIGFSEGYYFHLTEKESTLYQEDGHPRLRKFVFTPYAHTWDVPYGYEAVFDIPANYEQMVESMETVFDDCPVVRAETLAEGLELAMRVRTNKVCVSFTDDTWLNTFLREQEMEDSPTKPGSLRCIVDDNGDLLGITGWVKDVASCYVDHRGILRVVNIDAVRVDMLKTLAPHVVFAQGTSRLRWRMEQAPKSGKRVVIMAPGLEDWDGTTPRRWGIGASESCVIYMAEEMRKRGHEVTVYGPVSRSCIVGGVGYMPAQAYFIDKPLPDLFVSSRVPEWLKERRGKMQVLWMHDVPDVYVPRLSNDLIIDRYITISDWQTQRAKKLNYRTTKLCKVPNGLVRWPAYDVVRVPNRSVWVSQPERGIDNIHQMWQKRPDLFTDFWVVYGFYNLLNYARGHVGRTEDSFHDTCRFKFALRQMGAKIVGRIPHWQVQKLTQSCERWIYPSTFPETFCVAGLEALYNGAQCYVTNNGATMETLARVSLPELEDGEVPRRVTFPVESPTMLDSSAQQTFHFDNDHQRWFAGIDTYKGMTNKVGFSDPYYFWERVGDEWEALFNGK